MVNENVRMVHRNQLRENLVHEFSPYQQVINKEPSTPQTSTEPVQCKNKRKRSHSKSIPPEGASVKRSCMTKTQCIAKISFL